MEKESEGMLRSQSLKEEGRRGDGLGRKISGCDCDGWGLVADGLIAGVVP